VSLAEIIHQRALDAGFDVAGIAPIDAGHDLEFAQAWADRGCAGEMAYLKNPKRGDPRLILPSVKSVLCVGLVYNSTLPYSTETAEPRPPARAWISRYAWGRDYHKVMRTRLERLRGAIEELAPGAETRVYVDTGPIVERAFARLSGIGWVGKNTCLINQGLGSWIFLGVILTSLALEPDSPAFDRCGSCRRCLDACPTGALTEPYVMDASRCIAYFNIELKGSIPEQFRSAIGANLIGCDICQDVCPWNRDSGCRVQDSGTGHVRTPAVSALPEFQPITIRLNSERDRGPASESRTPSHEAREFSLFNPPLEQLASLTEDDFRLAFGDSPIKRASYRGWLRNLCVVMGNSGDSRCLPWLEEMRGHEDVVVREHAEWALAELARGGIKS
jgi:epoxyqueuosine reductase